jgi:hypothetical protein
MGLLFKVLEAVSETVMRYNTWHQKRVIAFPLSNQPSGKRQQNTSSTSSIHIGKLVIVCIAIGVLLAACSGQGNSSAHSSASATSNSSHPTTPVQTTSNPPTVTVQPCPNAVNGKAYWGDIIGTQSDVSYVEQVSCASLMGNNSLQALVTVRYYGSGQELDVYVYNNITDPSPTQIFKLLGLYKGDAKISRYGTLMTAEVDQHSSINRGKSNANYTQDLFREYQWSPEVGTMVQVTFPAIFPDLTRYQAEAAQTQVDHRQQSWRLSATQTAQALAARFLKWNPHSPATLVGGNGNNNLQAVVTVKSTQPGGGMITVKLSRLEGNAHNGIWEATSVTSPNMSITTPISRDILSSPTRVTGSVSATNSSTGTLKILDHLYNAIGQSTINGANSQGSTTFQTSISYTSTFKTGDQEGVLALYAYNAQRNIIGAVMLKEMLG